MHFLFYQIRHVLFEDEILKNYIYCSSPQSMAPTKFLSKFLTSKALTLKCLKIVKHFQWFETFTYNLQTRV
jgi:hypothetical protein